MYADVKCFSDTFAMYVYVDRSDIHLMTVSKPFNHFPKLSYFHHQFLLLYLNFVQFYLKLYLSIFFPVQSKYRKLKKLLVLLLLLTQTSTAVLADPVRPHRWCLSVDCRGGCGCGCTINLVGLGGDWR